MNVITLTCFCSADRAVHLVALAEAYERASSTELYLGLFSIKKRKNAPLGCLGGVVNSIAKKINTMRAASR